MQKSFGFALPWIIFGALALLFTLSAFTVGKGLAAMTVGMLICLYWTFAVSFAMRPFRQAKLPKAKILSYKRYAKNKQ